MLLAHSNLMASASRAPFPPDLYRQVARLRNSSPAGARRRGDRMKRRDFIAAITLASIAFPLCAHGETTKIYRIVILETISAVQNAANFGALKQGLRDRGFVEGQNLRFEYRSADGRGDRFPDLAAELVRLGVDLIATRG